MRILKVLVVSLSLAATATSTVEARELRVLSAFAPNLVMNQKFLMPFLSEVEKTTNGELTFKVSGPDAVPTFEQFQPAQVGVFDVLFTHPSYHSGTTTTAVAMDAVRPDPTVRREAGYFDDLRKIYDAYNLRLVSVPILGSIGGYRYFLREPVSTKPPFQGKKIRGTIAYRQMIDRLGGSAVNMPAGEIYTALQRGVIDGAGWATNGGIDFKLNEVAHYMVVPTFGSTSMLLFFNKRAWESLSSEQRERIEAVAKDMEIRTVQLFDKLIEDETAKLKELGVKETTLLNSDASDLSQLWADSVWTAAEQVKPEVARTLREKLRKSGLTH